MFIKPAPGEIVNAKGGWLSTAYLCYVVQMPQNVTDHYRKLFARKLPYTIPTRVDRCLDSFCELGETEKTEGPFSPLVLGRKYVSFCFTASQPLRVRATCLGKGYRQSWLFV